MTQAQPVLEPLKGKDRIQSLASQEYPNVAVYYVGAIKRFTSGGKWKSQTAVCTSHMLFISTNKVKVSKAIPYKDIKEAIYGQYGAELIIVLTMFSNNVVKWRTTEGIKGSNPMQILLVISNLRARYFQGKGLPAAAVPQMTIERKQIGKTEPLTAVKSRILSSLPQPDPMSDEVLVRKDEEGSIGLSLSDHMSFIRSIPNSPCDNESVKQFLGRILSHIDGRPVNSIEEAHFMVTHSYGTHVILKFAVDAPTPQAGSPEAIPIGASESHSFRDQPSEESHMIVEEKELPPVTSLEPLLSKVSDQPPVRDRPPIVSTRIKEMKTVETPKKQPTPESTPQHLPMSHTSASSVSSHQNVGTHQEIRSFQKPQQHQQKRKPKNELVVVRQQDDDEEEDFGVMMEAVQNLVNRQSKTEDLLWSLLTTMDSSVEVNHNATGSDSGSFEGSPSRPTFRIQSQPQPQPTHPPTGAITFGGYEPPQQQQQQQQQHQHQYQQQWHGHPQNPANAYVETAPQSFNTNSHLQNNNTHHDNNTGGGNVFAAGSPTPNFREPQPVVMHSSGLHSYPTQSPSGAHNVSPQMYHIATTPLPVSQQQHTPTFQNPVPQVTTQQVNTPTPQVCRICHAHAFGAFCHSCGGRV